jgi:capsular exopolysaccharide synthesis family protein
MDPETQERGELVLPSADPAGTRVQTSRAIVIPRADPAVRSEEQEGEISPMSFLRALRRRAALAMTVALLAAGVAGPAAWFLVPSSPYTAEARLQIAAQPPKVLFQTVDNGGSDYGGFQRTQRILVKSRLVLSAALRNPRVSECEMIRRQADPLRWLGDQLRVEFVEGSEVMEISLTGDDPEALVRIVNAIKTSYMDEVVNVDARRRAARHEQLKKLRETYAGLLKEKREIMRKLAETIGSDERSALALRQQYAMEHLNYLQTELRGVQSQNRRLEAQLKASGRAQGGEPGEPPPLAKREVDKLVEQHPEVADLTEKLAKLEAQQATEKAKVRKLSRRPAAEPSLTYLADAVTATRQLLARRRKEVRPEVVRQAQRRGAGAADAEGQDLRRDLAMLGDLEHRLEEEIKVTSSANQSLAIHTLDLRGNQEEIAQMQATEDRIAAEVEAVNVEIQAPPRIRPIDDADVPRTRDDKKRYTVIGLVTLGSFFSGLVGITLLELKARKVDTADEVPAELGLDVIGALPILPAARKPQGAIARRETEKDRYWTSVFLESINAIRTLVQHTIRAGSCQVMMITSAIGGEGKTSLANHLALSLAGSGLRTLLIDADLRRPMMHRLFDRPLSPGLSELLRGAVDLDDVIWPTPLQDLTILTAGRCDRPTLRILSQGGVAPVFDRLKSRFDVIIVDSSPVLPVADAMQIARYVDTTLFSIFRDHSRKTKVKAAFERLQRLGVPVLGAVVTGALDGAYRSDDYGPYAYYPVEPESADAPSSNQPS